MLIKLQNFARECGVTDRAIQKHLKKHEKALEGHFERRGPNGTWLDDFAVEYIRGLMVQQPVVIADDALHRELEQLRLEVNRLHGELETSLKAQAELMGVQARLEAAETAKKLLEAAEDDLKARLAKQEQENSALRETLDEVRKMSWWQRMRWRG